MMVFKLALRNIHGAGLRSVINITIVALVVIGIIWMQGMYAGWVRMAEKQSREWLNADGRFTHKDYDRFDPFSWDKSFAPIPETLQPLIDEGNAVPILISSGVIYPGGRMMSVSVRGIPYEQTLLKIPTSVLKQDGIYIPALIGSNMAKSAKLEKGDIVTLRWRDIHGAFNAQDIIVAEIMNTPLQEIDNGQIWLDLAHLQTMKDSPNAATFITLGDSKNISLQSDVWVFQSLDELLIDLYNIMKSERIQALIMYAVLMCLAMVAIFDTQILAVFKRRKEIGTFTALGMTKHDIIRMFTLEGMMYAVLASVAGLILGFPLFYYFGTKGWKLPDTFQNFGIEGYNEALIFHYSPVMIISTIVIVIAITAFVSWLPCLRIARLKPTDALRGRLS